jgi:hypothetical protein
MSTSERTKLMFAILTPTIVVYMLFSGMWSLSRWSMYVDAWRTSVPVSFFGKVIDESGQPVSDAEVNIEIDRVNVFFIFGSDHWLSVDKLTAVTDKDGRFFVSGRRGRSVIIRKIIKSGYTYSYKDNKDSGFYYYQGMSIYRPDPQHPVNFLIRTKLSS